MAAREVPRPFKFHWGGGEIIEEFEGMRAALRDTPRLRELLCKLVE